MRGNIMCTSNDNKMSMMIKHQRRANTATPSNTAMPILVVRLKCTYGNMAESNLL